MGRFGVKSVSTDLVKGTAAKAGTALTTTTDDAFEAAVISAVDAGNQTAAADQNADLKTLITTETAKIGTGLTTAQLATVNKNIASATAALAAIGTADEVADVAKKTTTDITSRMQVDVKASVELDSGITLGARTRFRSTDGAAGVGFNAPTFSMSTGGLTVVVGNNYGQMYTAGAGGYNVGLTGLGFEADAFTGFDEYSSNGTGPQGADVNYTVGNLTMGVSHAKGSGSTQAAVSYSAGSVTIAAGMQDGKAKADDYSVASVDYAFGNGSVGLKYGDNNGTKTTVLGGSFDIAAATSLTAFVKDTNTATVKNVYGIGVSHDLGGAKLQAGYVDNADGSVADFGIVFNF